MHYCSDNVESRKRVQSGFVTKFGLDPRGQRTLFQILVRVVNEIREILSVPNVVQFDYDKLDELLHHN